MTLEQAFATILETVDIRTIKVSGISDELLNGAVEILRQNEDKELTFPADMAGCWLDGARGVYLGEGVIGYAYALGMPMQALGYEEEDASTESDWYCELWTAAEDYLGEFAPEGFYIGTSEGGGDFGMWAEEDEE